MVMFAPTGLLTSLLIGSFALTILAAGVMGEMVGSYIGTF